ncbi:MAG: phosphonoacetaldehyde hydrolase [Anaerolineaceae bacterium]|nr:phosphonoacetaldehyde hydrolase [Anaerolineaceae bacterium]
MNTNFQRGYHGRLKAVILDWAGTTVDYGSFAPTAVFLKLFANRGVQIKIEQARGPMGLMKKDHLRAIARYPDISRAWKEVHGGEISESDIDSMFSDFIPMQLECLADYAQVIPGVPQAVASFQELGLKVGSTTGYTREMMEVLAPAARANGYSPDGWVSSTDVPAGRPFPWMVYQNAIQLQVFPLEACVKIGDTLVDIQEGLNAGMWTIGLRVTGNMLGLTEEEVNRLPPQVLDDHRKVITERFLDAGAHFVVDSLADCPPIIAEINQLIADGLKP